jgi:CxxC motif-containing protein (DUF1111 family)
LFIQSLRLSIPGEGPYGSPNPDPHYGLQMQSFDTVQRKDKSARAGEGEVHVRWEKQSFRFADGSTVELRKPVVEIKHLNFGPLADGVMMSLRNSQPIFGLGYLEAVSESDILALAELQKSQGLNGRPKYVRDDINDKTSIGRFGWKANQPSIKQQIAAAFLADVGVTSAVYPEQSCTPVQKECWAALKGEELKYTIPNIHHLMLRARYNMQRHYEIYVVSATDGITADDIRDMFEANPQMSADTIRRLGQRIYSDRVNNEEILIT